MICQAQHEDTSVSCGQVPNIGLKRLGRPTERIFGGKAMMFRDLGNTGIKVSEIGLGTWELSGDVWGKKDTSTSLRALEVGIEAGANLIDTAAGYGSGHAEKLIGTFIKNGSPRREELVIVTKVKPECGQFAPPPNQRIDKFYGPQWIRGECEESLKRLGTDYIDVLLLHTWNRSWGAETEWHDELLRLKKDGKIRAFGISIPDEGITDANVQVALNLVEVIECVFSVFQQEPLYSLFPLTSKHGVGVIARSPFSSGVVVQDWTPDMSFADGDWRGSWPLKVKPGWLNEQISMADAVKPVLNAANISYSHGALRFVLASSEVSSVIPGSANPEHVSENLAAADSSIAANTVAEIRGLWLRDMVHGTYNGSI